MATISLTIPDAAVPRLLDAVAYRLSLTNPDGTPRSATNAEAKQYVAQLVKELVRGTETQQASVAAVTAVTELPVT